MNRFVRNILFHCKNQEYPRAFWVKCSPQHLAWLSPHPHTPSPPHSQKTLHSSRNPSHPPVSWTPSLHNLLFGSFSSNPLNPCFPLSAGVPPGSHVWPISVVCTNAGPFNTKEFWVTKIDFLQDQCSHLKVREGKDLILDLMMVMPAGDEAVGKKGACSLQSGWAAEAHRLPWLEAVEVSSQAAAAGEQLFFTSSGLSSFYTLRYRVLQPRDPQRLD